MNSAAWQILALREDMHRVWGRFDHGKPGITSEQIYVLLGLVAVSFVVAVVWLWLARREAKTFVANSSAKLFRELCAEHRLGFRNRRLIRRLAAARGVTDTASMFLEPRYYSLEELPETLHRDRSEICRLRDKLFD